MAVITGVQNVWTKVFTVAVTTGSLETVAVFREQVLASVRPISNIASSRQEQPPLADGH